MNTRSHLLIALAACTLVPPACATVVPNDNTGGGGGGGGTGGMMPAPTLALVSTEPPDSSTEVEPGAIVSATFTAGLDSESLTSTSFVLQGPDGAAVPGEVMLGEANTIVFVPDKRLSLLVEYTATLDADIASEQGAALGADSTWTFAVRDGAWRASQVFGDGTQPSTSPVAAIDDDENAVVVWEWEPVGSDYSMWANRSIAGLWGEQELLDTSDPNGDFDPQIAMGGDGNAFAVWEAFVDTGGVFTRNLWVSRFAREGGMWSTPQLLEFAPGFAGRPDIAMDSAGNAIAVWGQSGGTVDSIWASRYVRVNGSWDAPRLIETDDAGGAGTPAVAIDPEGNAVAAWAQSDGTRYNIWANRYDEASNAWAAARRIEFDNAGDAVRQDVAMDADGNAIAVWRQSDGTRNDIWTNRYLRASDSWGTPLRIDLEDAGDADDPDVDIDGAGNAVAVWRQLEGNRADIWANHYSREDDSWGVAERIELDDAGSASNPRLVVDTSGNAIAVWTQGDAGGVASAWANRYVRGGGWGTPQLLETGSDGVRSVRVALSPTGTALAVWSQGAAARSNRFD